MRRRRVGGDPTAEGTRSKRGRSREQADGSKAPSKKPKISAAEEEEHGSKAQKIFAEGEILVDRVNQRKVVTPPHAFQQRDYGAFMYFFKKLLGQPYLRRYFVEKRHPRIPYDMIRIDLHDKHAREKLDYISQKIRNKGDFIIDIAVQSENGGHYTSLKRENKKLEYMDSDPFNYGSDSILQEFIKKIPNPKLIYGNRNIDPTSTLGATRSIQNVSKLDTFCQSWSLFYITLANEYPDTHKMLDFQVDESIGHITREEAEKITDPEIREHAFMDIENTKNNFPKFKRNFLFLLDKWRRLFDDTEIDSLLRDKQFKNWTSAEIMEKLQEMERVVQGIETHDVFNEMICVNKETLNRYMVNS